ncbi:MAG: WD40 repeat domain-containing protein [Rhodospirillales bacterium]|nr:WD40 repeat domain-containing protein [Rhodospirillales bacterium]
MSTPEVKQPRVRTHALGAYIAGVGFTKDGETLAAATGAGEIHLRSVAGEDAKVVKAHAGAVLSFVPHPDGVSFLSGGDDGRLVRTTAAGETEELFRQQGRWIEALAAHPAGPFACAVGKELRVWAKGAAAPVATPAHPSTVAALDFSPDGSRVTAAHYGGVSVWQVAKPGDRPRTLVWKGSHVQVRYSPNGRFIATTTQDNAIHVWRLSSGQDMQMAGYRTKVRQLVWTADSRWLLSDAADCFVAWDFSGKGPEGQPPLEFGFGDGAVMTGIACHPASPFLVGGFENGGVRLGDLDGKRELVLHEAPVEDGKPVRAVAFSSDGWCVAAGAEDGTLLTFDLKTS